MQNSHCCVTLCVHHRQVHHWYSAAGILGIDQHKSSEWSRTCWNRGRHMHAGFWHIQRGNGTQARAESLAMMGELSAARQASESAGVAPGDRNTLNTLRNPARRPPAPREPPPPELMIVTPARPFDLDDDTFCRNLRSQTRSCAWAIGHDLRASATVVGI